MAGRSRSGLPGPVRGRDPAQPNRMAKPGQDPRGDAENDGAAAEQAGLVSRRADVTAAVPPAVGRARPWVAGGGVSATANPTELYLTTANPAGAGPSAEVPQGAPPGRSAPSVTPV